MSYANGIFNTDNFGANIKPSFSKKVFKKMPNGTAPLLAMTSALKREDVTSTTHIWGAESMPHYRTRLSSPLTATAAGTAQTISVVDTMGIIPSTTWLIPSTGEMLYVESIISGTQVNVRRGFGSIPAQATAAGTSLTATGNAQQEASLRPTAQANFSYSMDNQTQILRNSYAMSGTAQAIEEFMSRSGGTVERLAKNKADAAMAHAMDIERSIIFGQRTSTYKDGQPLRTMDGVISLINKYAPTNVKTLGQTTTFKQLSKALEPLTSFSTDPSTGSQRVIFTGNTGYSFLNEMGRSVNGNNVQFNRGENGFGMRYTNFMTDFADFKVVTHPLFNTEPEWSSMMLVLDLPTLFTGYLGGRDTRLMGYNDQGQAANTATSDSLGMDAAMGTFLTEMTIGMGLPEANGILYGACQVACDPCLTSAPGFTAEFCISHPCDQGAVKAGDTIMLQIKAAKPLTQYSIITPTGSAALTTDAQGNAAKQYTFAANATASTYVFAVPAGAGQTDNVTWTGMLQTACITACDPCDATVVTTQPEPAR